MTTVFGSQFITSRRAISHGAQADVIKALGLHFSLDFLNCLDAIIPFVRFTHVLLFSALMKVLCIASTEQTES